ncbi:MAG: alpha-E domain-containing protein [Hyphomonadaceae bacterium]|nr:alpha-E domain-containing protein [Hyphomonadaceae bacterium]
MTGRKGGPGMLSRVAENLFWIGRYIERAEAVARMVDAARRMTALPAGAGWSASNEWASVLIAAGARETFGKSLEDVNAREAIHHLMFDLENSSSVASCFTNARENGRSIRFALTQDCWEALNGAWAEMRQLPRDVARGGALSNLIEWAKAKSAAFRGTMHGTMLRGDGYDFLRMGMAVERTDSTARLLDVKYHVLLPSASDVGSAPDHYQWLSLLQAAGAQRAYYAVQQADLSAQGVAEFMILEPRFPRGILFNLHWAVQTVSDLEAYYGQESACQNAVAGAANRLENMDIESIMQFGLHEFLTEVIERNNEIANLLGKAYGFAPAVEEDSQAEDAAGQ